MNFTINDSYFTDNTVENLDYVNTDVNAGKGGVFSIINSHGVSFENSAFTDNTARLQGGVIHAIWSEVDFVTNTFERNAAK